MKTRLLCLLLLAGLAVPLRGQGPKPSPSPEAGQPRKPNVRPGGGQDPKLPPLPEGPLLKRAPDFATWTITVQNLASHGQSSPAPGEPASGDGKNGQDKLVVTGRSNVVKIGTTILEDNFDAKGKRTEIWHFGNVRVLKPSDGSEPIVSPEAGGGGDIYSVDFAVADFAGLDWISASTYAGLTKQQGRDCIQFNGTVSPLEARNRRQEADAINQTEGSGKSVTTEMRVPAVAYIDLETRLPLLVTFGDEQRSYQYGTPPTTSFSLPPEVTTALKAYAERIKRLSAPSGRAF